MLCQYVCERVRVCLCWGHLTARSKHTSHTRVQQWNLYAKTFRFFSTVFLFLNRRKKRTAFIIIKSQFFWHLSSDFSLSVRVLNFIDTSYTERHTLTRESRVLNKSFFYETKKSQNDFSTEKYTHLSLEREGNFLTFHRSNNNHLLSHALSLSLSHRIFSFTILIVHDLVTAFARSDDSNYFCVRFFYNFLIVSLASF